MNEVLDVELANRRAMAAPETVSHYSRVGYLDPGEALVYGAAAEEFTGEPLLDIGVGGGRTVPALTAISQKYTAIDYTPAMVTAVRQRFPGLDVRHGDACSLPEFSDASFAFIVFSCGGLDMVGAPNRLEILAEVFRLLRPGGLFAFSTHNWEHRCEHRQLPLVNLQAIEVQRPVQALRLWVSELKRAPGRWQNRRKLRKLETVGEDSAILVSPYHDFSTLMHYITLSAQQSQLAKAGFEANARVASNEGQWLHGAGSHSPLLHFLARKPR